MVFLKMNTIFTINLVFFSVLVVAGSKIEAIDGKNATISFDIDEVEKADQVKIIFKEDKKEYAVVIAQKPWVYDDPPSPGVTLILGKGRLSLTIQDVNISRSGLYKARVFTGANVCERNATLVVNKAAVSSTISPPHSSSSPKPASSSDLRGLYALIPVVVVIIIIIFIILCVCFCKHRMILCFKRKKELETSCSDFVVVEMNGCGENTESLLTDTGVS